MIGGTFKEILIVLVVSFTIMMCAVWTSEAIFGDLTNSDSFKPLLVIIPIIGIALYFLIKKINGK
jgi:hypothetical protein